MKLIKYTIQRRFLSNQEWADCYSLYQKDKAIEYLQESRKSFPKEEYRIVEVWENALNV